jgi:hypothetical protein
MGQKLSNISNVLLSSDAKGSFVAPIAHFLQPSGPSVTVTAAVCFGRDPAPTTPTRSHPARAEGRHEGENA